MLFNNTDANKTKQKQIKADFILASLQQCFLLYYLLLSLWWLKQIQPLNKEFTLCLFLIVWASSCSTFCLARLCERSNSKLQGRVSAQWEEDNDEGATGQTGKGLRDGEKTINLSTQILYFMNEWV